MRTRIALAAAAAALALPAAAAAKELGPVTACGANPQCRTTDDRRVLEDLHSGLREGSAPLKATGFISLRFTARGPEGEDFTAFEQQWLPKAGLVVQQEGSYRHWLQPNRRARAALRKLTRGLVPRSANDLDAALRTADARAREVHEPDAPREARVVEVFDPAAEAAQEERDEGGFPAVPVALAALVLAGGGLALRRRG